MVKITNATAGLDLSNNSVQFFNKNVARLAESELSFNSTKICSSFNASINSATKSMEIILPNAEQGHSLSLPHEVH